MSSVLYIVVPCYNEEEIIKTSADILKEKIKTLIKNKKISKDSKILFVNDGSNDKTWENIVNLNSADKIFTGISLSINQGHQNALLAGLLTAKDKADVTISIDADLQDDVDVIDEMVDKYNEGFDIVYGVRNDRKKDSFFKKKSAELFYNVMNKLGANTIFNHADFRLMNKKSLEFLSKFTEVNLFLRGIVPKIGLKHCNVYYTRKQRQAGVSKYPLNKMVSFAVNGITSCSIKLIHMIFILGVFFLFLSTIMVVYCILSLITHRTVSGWTSLMTSIWALCGTIMVSLGIVGEYVGKIYMETKKRPRFMIAENLDAPDSEPKT